MKYLLCICLSIGISFSLLAQNSYEEAIRQGDRAYKNGQYKKAIDKYFSAIAFEPDKRPIVQKKINIVFNKIETLKNEAETQRKRADIKATETEVAKRATEKALDSIKIAKREVEIQKEIAINEREKTKLALEEVQSINTKKQKLIDAFYFYEGKYALAYKNIGASGKYGFVDKEGEIVIDYIYDYAIPFDQRNGLAKVERNQQKFLLDTTGREYLLAEEENEITSNTKAIDLRGKGLNVIPSKIYSNNIEILLLENNNIQKVPEKIYKLTQLKFLDLSRNNIKTLPYGIGNLSRLEYLSLAYNNLNTMPEDINSLHNLTYLNLRNNRWSELPDLILPKLKFLDISNNQIVSLAPITNSLENVEYFDFSNNEIFNLAPIDNKLKNVKIFSASNNKITNLAPIENIFENVEIVNLSKNEIVNFQPQKLVMKNVKVIDLRENKVENNYYHYREDTIMNTIIVLRDNNQNLQTNRTERNMVFIEGGTFLMGNEDGIGDEKPVHKVIVDNFWMDKYEVTVQHYLAFCKETGYSIPDYKDEYRNLTDSDPITNVSWYDAIEYCNWHSKKDNLSPCYTLLDSGNVICHWDANGYRLPTEAEWEYAAGGGKFNRTSTKWDRYKRLGLYDMSGHVWEWCWDWYNKGYYYNFLGMTIKNPRGSFTGESRAVRGNSYGDDITIRGNARPVFVSRDLGFRCVKSF